MSLLYKSTASQVVMLKVFLSSDHVSAATGKTVAIKISKNGGAFGDPNAGATNATEVSAGWYKVTLDATDTATEGDLVVRGTSASCDDSERVFRVHLPPNFGIASIDGSGRVKADLDTIKTQTVTCAAGVTILASVGTASTSTAQTGDSYARIGAPAGASVSADIAAAKTVVDAIKVKTDSLTFTVAGMADVNVIDWKSATAPAMTGDAFARLGAPAGASIAADIATRLATSGYTAPPSAASVASAVLTTQLTESYAANGIAPTLTEGLMAVHQMLMTFAIAGTSYTVKKLDGSTTAFVVTLDDATNPTATART